MGYLLEIVAIIDHMFRPIIALSASIFTIFFAYKKIGNKISVTYSITLGGSSAARINNMVFQNKKDKSLSIYKVIAVFDKTYYLEIHKCSPPLILKPYESVSIETEEYSHLYVNGDRYFPKLYDAEIYIESDDKTIKCKARTHKILALNYMPISKGVNRFNGIVYTDNFAYILVYVVNDVIKTAFLYDSGVILEEWDYNYNAIRVRGEKLEPDEIYDFLEKYYSQTIDSYVLYKRNESKIGFEFLKSHDFN